MVQYKVSVFPSKHASVENMYETVNFCTSIQLFCVQCYMEVTIIIMSLSVLGDHLSFSVVVCLREIVEVDECKKC